MLWTDNMCIPKGSPRVGMAQPVDRLLLRPGERGDHRGLGQLRLPGPGRARGHARRRSGPRQQPAHLPARRLVRPALPVPVDDRDRGDGLGRGVQQGDGSLARHATEHQPPDHRAVCAAGARPPVPGDLLRLPGDPDVPGLALDGQHPGRLPADLELEHLPGLVPRVLAVDRPIDRLRRAGDDPRLRARLPARLRDRVPWRRVQEPAAVPGHRTVLHELPAADHLVEDHLLGRRDLPRPAQDRRHHPAPTSSCWPRRRRSSPASPTTSCRS